MSDATTLVSRPENKFKNIETLKVIARSPPASPEREQARDGGQAAGDEAISCKLAKSATFTKWDCFASLAMTAYESLIITKNFWDTTLTMCLAKDR
jgi:hypothetical protein